MHSIGIYLGARLKCFLSPPLLLEPIGAIAKTHIATLKPSRDFVFLLYSYTLALQTVKQPRIRLEAAHSGGPVVCGVLSSVIQNHLLGADQDNGASLNSKVHNSSDDAGHI